MTPSSALCAEGNAVDVEVCCSSERTRFQITTAYPEWDEPGDEARDGGYIRHALEMAGVNQGTPEFGGGQIEKRPDSRIVSAPEPDQKTSTGARGIWA